VSIIERSRDPFTKVVWVKDDTQKVTALFDWKHSH
jgi:hypothetical protein